MISRGFIRWNLRYIRIINSCDRGAIRGLFSELLELEGAFTRRRYLWNWIRGRDFYVNLANMVVDEVRDLINDRSDDPLASMALVERIIRMVMETERSEKVRRSFIWNITKHAPLLTLDTVKYMSAERLLNQLTNENTQIVTDDTMGVIIGEINRLRGRINDG